METIDQSRVSKNLNMGNLHTSIAYCIIDSLDFYVSFCNHRTCPVLKSTLFALKLSLFLPCSLSALIIPSYPSLV